MSLTFERREMLASTTEDVDRHGRSVEEVRRRRRAAVCPGEGSAVARNAGGVSLGVAAAAESLRGCRRSIPKGAWRWPRCDRDSPAWKAGLRRGEYISHVGTRRVSTPQEFHAAVAEQQGAVRLQMTAARGEAANRTVSVE